MSNNENNNSRRGSGSAALRQLSDEQEESESIGRRRRRRGRGQTLQPAAPPQQGPQLPHVEPNQNYYCCLFECQNFRRRVEALAVHLTELLNGHSGAVRMASCRWSVTPRICSIERKFKSEVLPHLSKINFHIWSVFHGRTRFKE